MVKAVIRGERVTLRQAEWSGASPGLLEKLEAVTQAGLQTTTGSDPSPELTTVQYVMLELGGKVTDYVSEDDSAEGRIY